jgi:type II secretory pathway component PulF
VIRASVEGALPEIAAGASLHAAFRDAGRMERMALAMMKAGEDTGNLGHTLRELAEFYEKRCADALTALQQTSGPVLTVITGAYLYLGF